MIDEILAPMNHREIEYNAKKLSGGDIPDSFLCARVGEKCTVLPDGTDPCRGKLPLGREEKVLLEWLDETGKRVFDDDLVMDYGTDCLRLYLLFEKTPKANDAPYYDSWQEGALEGIYKFLGRYRRMILAADEWNRRGNYKEETFSLNHALEDTCAKINKYIGRGNTMPNRHNIVSAMMELLNLYQKELRIGEIVHSFHMHAVETAVPHGEALSEANTEQGRSDLKNPAVTDLCKGFIALMMPYAPDLSKTLWSSIK